MPTVRASSSRAATGATLSPRDPRLAAWRALITAHARLVDRLDHELRQETGMSLPEYSALLQLAEAPERRLRMSQLAQGIFLTRSGVTRLIDRLQADGLVARTPCASDGRGAEAVLTDVGLARLRSASRTHLRGIGDYFLERLSPDDLDVVERTMTAVSDALEPAG